MDIKEIAKKLKEQWEPCQQGQCYMLSAAMGKREACECHLCLIDNLVSGFAEKLTTIKKRAVACVVPPQIDLVNVDPIMKAFIEPRIKKLFAQYCNQVRQLREFNIPGWDYNRGLDYGRVPPDRGYTMGDGIRNLMSVPKQLIKNLYR